VLELLNEVRFGGVAERLEIREDTRGLGQRETTLGTVPIDRERPRSERFPLTPMALANHPFGLLVPRWLPPPPV
jgi:hypothetical protein